MLAWESLLTSWSLLLSDKVFNEYLLSCAVSMSCVIYTCFNKITEFIVEFIIHCVSNAIIIMDYIRRSCDDTVHKSNIFMLVIIMVFYAAVY